MPLLSPNAEWAPIADDVFACLPHLPQTESDVLGRVICRTLWWRAAIAHGPPRPADYTLAELTDVLAETGVSGAQVAAMLEALIAQGVLVSRGAEEGPIRYALRAA